MTSLFFLDSIDDLPEKVDEKVKKTKGRPLTETVGFFDLSGSTSMKLTKGNERGIFAALCFSNAASEIIQLTNGVLVKELGDGVLCRFPDPIDGCRAAINMKITCTKMGLLGSFGLTIGRITKYDKPSNTEDIYGDSVDRC